MAKIIKPIGDGKRKILSLEEAMKQIDAHQPPKTPPPQEGIIPDKEVISATSSVRYVSYDWEPLAARVQDGDKQSQVKKLTYDESLARLQAAGYQRHPRPNEIFCLLIDFFEDKFKDNPDVRHLASDVFWNSGWTSIAMENDATDGKLTCYIDPKNLRWDDSDNVFEYVLDGKEVEFIGLDTFGRIFDISKVPCATWIDVKDFFDKGLLDEDLVMFLYNNRKPDELPKSMCERPMRIYLPAPGRIQPVSIENHLDINGGDYAYRFAFDAHKSASRGLRLKK